MKLTNVGINRAFLHRYSRRIIELQAAMAEVDDLIANFEKAAWNLNYTTK